MKYNEDDNGLESVPFFLQHLPEVPVIDEQVPEPAPTFDYIATIGVVGDSPSFEITIVAHNMSEALRKALAFAYDNGGCDDRVLTIGQVMPCYTLPNGTEVNHE